MKRRTVRNEAEMIEFGREFGVSLKGGEALELIGDLGAGKTTFVKGLALGLGVKMTVNSPSFTIMKEYPTRGGVILKHYDFYRLETAGLMKDEITESLSDPKIVTVVEWAKEVAGILPKNRTVIKIAHSHDEGRVVEWT